MAILKIDQKTFEERVLQGNKPVLVDFSAPWCVYCRRLAPVLERMDGQEGVPEIMEVNIDEQAELAGRYSVETIPTLLLFQNGKPGEPLIAPGSAAQVMSWLREQGI